MTKKNGEGSQIGLADDIASLESVKKIKIDLDKKYKEINTARKRRKERHEKLMASYSSMGLAAVREAEYQLSLMDREIKNLESQRDEIETRAYGTWLPRIRKIAGEDA